MSDEPNCPLCDGSGKASIPDTCDLCEGSGYVQVADGAGGWMSTPCARCDAGQIITYSDCLGCFGTGKKYEVEVSD